MIFQSVDSVLNSPVSTAKIKRLCKVARNSFDFSPTISSEDLYQEVLLKLCLTKYPLSSQTLSSICNSTFVDLYRREHAIRRSPISQTIPTKNSTIISREIWADLQNILSPFDFQFFRYYFIGFSRRELAAKFGLSVSSTSRKVNSILRRITITLGGDS